MNEPKSSRYHRLKRRAGAISLAASTALVLAFLWLRPSLPLAVYVLLLAIVNEAIALPAAFYRSFVLDRRYELSSEPVSAWFRDHAKAFGLAALFAIAAAETVYALIRWIPDWWWFAAACLGTAVTVLLAKLAPVALLPLFYRFTPLDRPALTSRLMALSQRAGVSALGVYEWGLGSKTRRANAALVGSGGNAGRDAPRDSACSA